MTTKTEAVDVIVNVSEARRLIAVELEKIKGRQDQLLSELGKLEESEVDLKHQVSALDLLESRWRDWPAVTPIYSEAAIRDAVIGNETNGVSGLGAAVLEVLREHSRPLQAGVISGVLKKAGWEFTNPTRAANSVGVTLAALEARDLVRRHYAEGIRNAFWRLAGAERGGATL